MNGNDGPGPLHIEARRELLDNLLGLQNATGLALISPEELLLIQQMWKAARDPDGLGVARIVNKQRGVVMNTDLNELNSLRKLEEEIAQELGVQIVEAAFKNSLRTSLANVVINCRLGCITNCY